MSRPFTDTQYQQKLFIKATTHHQAGELQQALQCYQKIIKKFPKHADALHLSGIILADQGKTKEGLFYINRAITFNSSFPPYYLNRGLIYKRLGQFDSAIKDFSKAISLNYKNAQIYCHLGESLFAKEDIDEAIKVYKQAIELDANDPTAYHNLGSVYLEEENYAAAESYYRKTLELKSDLAETLSNLGIVKMKQDKIDEAINCHQRAIAIKPNFIQAYINLGLAYNYAYRFIEAEAVYQKALNIAPNNAELYLNFGVNYRSQNKIDLALACFRKAMEINPSSEAEFNEAISLLLLGDFKNGWQKYLSRFHVKDRAIDLNYPQPLWQGEDLADKLLLVHVEQGLGDTIQFVRYLKLFKNPNNIFLACQQELIPLFTPYFKNILPRRIPEQHFDYQLPIMSLALRFNTNSLEEIPFSDGYISPPQNHRLNGLLKEDKFKIGLVWAGNKINPNDRNRTITLSMFGDLLELPNVKFYSLQFGENAKDIITNGFQGKLSDLSYEIKDLSDSASLISQLDLLITVDTAIAHLAGAMAKPVWALIQYAPDFRWLLERNDSPWYKSMRLFRQKKVGDWGEILQDVKNELQNVVSLWKPR